MSLQSLASTELLCRQIVLRKMGFSQPHAYFRLMSSHMLVTELQIAKEDKEV